MDGSEQKEQRRFWTHACFGPVVHGALTFILGFDSHHDTYFSLKQNWLFVTIVSPLLIFSAMHNGFKACVRVCARLGACVGIKPSGTEKIITDSPFFSSLMITLSVPGRRSVESHSGVLCPRYKCVCRYVVSYVCRNTPMYHSGELCHALHWTFYWDCQQMTMSMLV